MNFVDCEAGVDVALGLGRSGQSAALRPLESVAALMPVSLYPKSTLETLSNAHLVHTIASPSHIPRNELPASFSIQASTANASELRSPMISE